MRGATWARLYARAFEELMAEGHSVEEAEGLAEARADELYWELVDIGRQRAKDGEGR